MPISYDDYMSKIETSGSKFTTGSAYSFSVTGSGYSSVYASNNASKQNLSASNVSKKIGVGPEGISHLGNASAFGKFKRTSIERKYQADTEYYIRKDYTKAVTTMQTYSDYGSGPLGKANRNIFDMGELTYSRTSTRRTYDTASSKLPNHMNPTALDDTSFQYGVTGSTFAKINTSNPYKSMSVLYSMQLINTDTKQVDSDLVNKYFSSATKDPTVFSNAVKTFNQIEKKTRALRKSGELPKGDGGTATLGADATEDGVSFYYLDKDGKKLEVATMPNVSPEDAEIISMVKAGALAGSIDNGSKTSNPYYRLLTSGSIDAKKLDIVMKHGFLSNAMNISDASFASINKIFVI